MPRDLRFLQLTRWAVLIVVALLGSAMTYWVYVSLLAVEHDRQEQRFKLEASQRSAALIKQLNQPLENLATLRRLFGSVEQVDWPTFRKFAEPMSGLSGVHAYLWFPRVSAGERAAFEADGRKLWGEQFAIRGAGGEVRDSSEPAFYFPLLYVVPSELGAQYGGYDANAHAPHARLIEQAASSGALTVSEVEPLVVDPRQADMISLALPVYRGGGVPQGRDERRERFSGVLSVLIHLRELFSALNPELEEAGFGIRLLDQRQRPEKQLLVSWNNDLEYSPGSAPPLVYSEDFQLAGHTWTVEVEATCAWFGENRPRPLHAVPLLGLLGTLVLLFYIRRLLGRSALAETLQERQAEDARQRRLTEAWANKLSLAVEQNPATVLITDTIGRIEYVNRRFAVSTGYALEEALGKSARLLFPQDVDPSLPEAMGKALQAGSDWQGELQLRRRDGSLFWARALVSPVKDGLGQIVNYVGIVESIDELRQIMQRLQESENRLRAVVSVMAEGLVVVSPQGRFVFANRAAEEFMGCAAGGLLGRCSEDLDFERLREDGSLCAPADLPVVFTRSEGRPVRDAVLGFRFPDGALRWMEINTSPLPAEHLDDGCGVVMTLSDISARRGAEEQLKLAFEALRCSGEGILVTDAQHRIIMVNPAFASALGFADVEILGKTPEYFASGRHDEAFHAEVREALASYGHWQGEVWNQRKNGDVFPEWLGISVVREVDGTAKHLVYIYSDMSERKEAQRRIELLVHHDTLTGLPNRLLLRDRVEQAKAHSVRQHSRVALMFLDLDRFKTINDSLGHPVGDLLLREVVERLKQCVRESDTISRQGGDEFVILLNDVPDSESVSRIAEKIEQRMAEPLSIGQHTLSSSFSIGIALFPDDGDDFDTLLQKADTAMYHAKECGRNTHRFFTEQMNRKVVEHLTLETQLRQALENGEFVLHYQPQMDLQEGGIVGVEALIRWNSPESGLISPARFIPVAEDSGLIVPIGAWVLNEACRQAKAWQDAGLPPFTVAVNLSAVQFRRMDLVGSVINALVLSDLDARWLELELTESILIQDAEDTLEVVRRLKALGVRLSVDDFGTGYSSLTYLKRFAVDKLKIDQSFVRDLVGDPDDAAIVRAIIQMARSLKLKTIAEGVESEEQGDLLRMYDCDEIQGYWFSRPLPAAQLEEFVRRRRGGGARGAQGRLL